MVTKEQIINDSHKVAIEALKNFFRNLGFNEEAFNHLYNIPTFFVDFLKPGDEAIYIHSESTQENQLDNTIAINSKQLNKYINLINQRKEDYKKVVLHYAATLVHETIHANRVIIMDYVTKDQNKKNSPKKWNVKSNLVSEFYHNTNILSEEEESDRVYYQGSFEETITEALAVMIIKTRNKDEFDLENVNDSIQNSSADMRVKIGSQILNDMGIDTVKWFMTAAYENSYYDKFEHTFKEKYNDFLYDVDDIYSSVICDGTVNSKSVYDVKRTLEEKTKNKR